MFKYSYYLLRNTHPILIHNLCDISAKKHDDIFLMIETHNPRNGRNPKTYGGDVPEIEIKYIIVYIIMLLNNIFTIKIYC